MLGKFKRTLKSLYIENISIMVPEWNIRSKWSTLPVFNARGKRMNIGLRQTSRSRVSGGNEG